MEVLEVLEVSKEKLISLAEAAELLPKKKAGKKISIRTIERWIRFGHHGIKLEGGKFGDALCTSAEALQRFSVRLMQQDREKNCEAPAATPHRSPAEARQANAKAKRELEKAGWGGKSKGAKTSAAKAGAKAHA